MKKHINIIKKSRFFSGMSEDDILNMLGCLSAAEKTFEKGEYIYHAGDTDVKAAIVLDGAVHVYKEDYWGNNSILAEISPGELLGEVYSVLQNQPLAVNAVAAQKVKVLFIDMKKVFTSCSSICSHHSKLIENFVYVMASKNLELTRKMEHLSQRSTRDKLLSYLSEQSLKQGRSHFEIPFNRQQMADYLSVDRSAMSKELGKLRDEGVLEFNKNRFELKEDVKNDIKEKRACKDDR